MCLYLRAGKKEKDGKTIKEECALWKQRADKKGRMAAVSGVGRRGSHACVYCSFFSRYSFIASFTMSFSDMFFLMARIKYNVDDGWVRVSIDADHKDFYVTVADSGMGIPEDSLDRIFERFYRVDKSHSREIGGTGLGLAITRSTITMHHGVVKVFSKEGEGTTFSVRVPLSYIP